MNTFVYKYNNIPGIKEIKQLKKSPSKHFKDNSNAPKAGSQLQLLISATQDHQSHQPMADVTLETPTQESVN